MRLAIAWLVIGGLSAQTPSLVPSRGWRNSLAALPATPPPNTSEQDIANFERNMQFASSYFGGISPGANPAQWEANRALVRRMAAYLYGLQALSGNAQLRLSIRHAQRSFETLGLAGYLAWAAGSNQPYADAQPPGGADYPPPPGPPAPSGPPFALTIPESAGVSEADKETAADLHTRYETDAAHSAGIWQNAETLRQSLAASGLGLNVQTSTSLIRLQGDYTNAAAALSHNDWESAKISLQQAEAETDKIAKTVGH